MLAANYQRLKESLVKKIAEKRIITDPLRLLAYGTDASFYRLTPKMVVQVHDEDEVREVIRLTHEMNIPVTFRAAGTSLSGQALSDSVLVVATHRWRRYQIMDEGEKITLQPGIIGAKANALLAPLGRKIGPDPASITAAMIGGIASNNASGMCCGTAQNSYQTVADIRLVFGDGTLLDTASEESKARFKETHADFIASIIQLHQDIKADVTLTERIKAKYKIKNTTGYSLNALVDYDDPFEIIKHLIIGAEGTLAFISNITYHTVVDHKYKSCALMIFDTVEKACTAVPLLKKSPVSAVELLDRKSIRSVENDPDAPAYFKTLPESSSVLLVECQGSSEQDLAQKEKQIREAISTIPTLQRYVFTSDPKEYNFNWKARKGLLASVGGLRATGTTCLIEDVAFPIEHLAKACLDIQALFAKYGYDDAVLFGHALEGNLHLVFSQNFGEENDLKRYADMMDELVEVVVDRYDGSLKAEHGTGRNMAPFVEKEWGATAYQMMKRIKTLFDPKSLLNPGVIINDNHNVHLENIKPLPASHELIDKCMECGFCEPNCVSEGLTLSPRQRIVIAREISRLKRHNERPEYLAYLERAAKYDLEQTCAGDGLCQLACPVSINTGAFVKDLRTEQLSNRAKGIGVFLGSHMAATTSVARGGLATLSGINAILGDKLIDKMATGARKLTRNHLPKWNSAIPKAAKRIQYSLVNSGQVDRVVYFPACVSRTMGVSKADPKGALDLVKQTEKLLQRVGFTIIYPEKVDGLCCGMVFDSKGIPEEKKRQQKQLEEAFWQASEEGKYPILFDNSPCYESFIAHLKQQGLTVYDPISFMLERVMPHLPVTRKKKRVTIFPVCSVKKIGKDKQLLELAKLCAENVDVVKSNCCGFAGDKGFNVPELNKYGLRHLSDQMNKECDGAYSTSRTCEIGLSEKSGYNFKSIFYLIDEVTI